jgi:hypothetical protein
MLDESGGRLYENNEAAQRAASRAQNRTVRLTAFGGSLTASPRARRRWVEGLGLKLKPVRVDKKAKPTPKGLGWVSPSVPGTGHVGSAKSIEDQAHSCWIVKVMPLLWRVPPQ